MGLGQDWTHTPPPPEDSGQRGHLRVALFVTKSAKTPAVPPPSEQILGGNTSPWKPSSRFFCEQVGTNFRCPSPLQRNFGGKHVPVKSRTFCEQAGPYSRCPFPLQTIFGGKHVPIKIFQTHFLPASPQKLALSPLSSLHPHNFLGGNIILFNKQTKMFYFFLIFFFPRASFFGTWPTPLPSR